VNTESKSRIHREIYSHGIYYKAEKRQSPTLGTEHLHSSQAKYLEGLESGQLDTFICGIPAGEVPEYEVFDFEQTRILMTGWRSIIMALVKQKLVDLDKARNLFNCQSLGESDYDKMDFFKKFEFAKKLAKKEGSNA